MRDFVIFGMTRTGSVMLTSRLDSHPDIECYGPLFIRKTLSGLGNPKMKWVGTTLPSWDKIEDRVADYQSFLKQVVTASRQGVSIGFKHFLIMEADVTRYLLSREDLLKIHLKRDNRLATYSSELLVRDSGIDHVYTGQTVGRQGTVPFSAEDFALYVKRRDAVLKRWEEPLRQAGTIEISYEQARKPDGLGEILSLIGVDPTALGDPWTLKKNSDTILDRFSNPDEADAWLTAHGHEAWRIEG